MVKLKQDFGIEHTLVRYANKMAGFYGHPVYLVGSQLTSETPRDIDIICIIPDQEFKYRWFPTWYRGENKLSEEIDDFYLGIHTGIHKKEHWDWYEDMVKKTLFGIKQTRLPIDFKVQSEKYAATHFKDLPRLRLDTREH